MEVDYLSRLNKLMQFCNIYYSKKKMAHALRVADYALAKPRTLGSNPYNLYMIALAHDLLEDTECNPDELCDIIGTDNFNSVLLLSKDDNTSYEDYIREIINSNDSFAFLVKQADLKDHMTLTETLTEKLKDKYVPILHYFL